MEVCSRKVNEISHLDEKLVIALLSVWLHRALHGSPLLEQIGQIQIVTVCVCVCVCV